MALRARIVLASADGLNQAQVAQQVGVNVETARLGRQRWLALHVAALDDLPVRARLSAVPRPGKPSRLTAEQVCQITALACEAPATSGRPISQWTSRAIADELQRRGIVERISPRHAARLLTRGICART